MNDVHIRYEDAITCGSSGAFACGVTVSSFFEESCDSDWRRGFTLLSDADASSYKLMELQNLAVYWDDLQVPGELYANYGLSELTVGHLFTLETRRTFA